MAPRQATALLPRITHTLALRIGLAAALLFFAAMAWTTATAQAAPQWRGVQLHSLWWDSSDADMDRELDLARQLGANHVRLDVAWGNLEEFGKNNPNPTYLARLDRFMAGAEARGLKVLAMIWSTPCWASSAPSTLKQNCAAGWWGRDVAYYPPSNPQDFADIVRWFNTRYAPKLAGLEIWNEPNLASKFFLRADDPAAAYTTLLRAAYPAAKQAAPNVPVLGASLSDADSAFLNRLYAAGIQGYYDGLAIHPYADYSAWTKLRNLRNVQLGAGDTKPIWATEYGWPTGASGWHVTEAQQAAELRQAYIDLGPLTWVMGATVYNLRNKGTDPNNMEDNFGLVRRDYSAKPAFAAVQESWAAGGTGGGETGGSTGGNTGGTTGGGDTSGGTTGGGTTTGGDTTSGGTTSGGTTSGGTTTSPKPKKRRARASVLRTAGSVYVQGTAEPFTRVRVRVTRCGGRAAAVVSVRANRSGRFKRRLGSLRRFRRCRVAVA